MLGQGRCNKVAAFGRRVCENTAMSKAAFCCTASSFIGHVSFVDFYSRAQDRLKKGSRRVTRGDTNSMRKFSRTTICAASHGRSQKGHSRQSSDAAASVFYLAYASNLSPHVFGPDAKTSLRRVTPLSQRRGVLLSHSVSYFPTGLPFEPAFATLTSHAEIPSADAVHGVLYELSPKEFEQIRRSEGISTFPFGSVLGARVIDVRVRIYDEDIQEDEDNRFVIAKTFTWPVVKPLARILNSLPSPRYLRHIADGWDYHGLDQAGLPPYVGQYLAQGNSRIKGKRSNLVSWGRALFEPDVLLRRSASSSPVLSTAVATFDEDMSARASKIRYQESGDYKDSSLRLIHVTPQSKANLKTLQPRLFYIPGIDGTGLSILSQLPSLTEYWPSAPRGYDVWAARMPYENRENWDALAKSLYDLLLDAADGAPSVTIVGESMGAALAMLLAIENARMGCKLRLNKLVLINPASSFRRSQLASAWIQLASNLPSEIYDQLVGPAVAPFIIDPSAVPLTEVPKVGRERLEKLRVFLARARHVLPKEAIMHRLSLLNDFALSTTDYQNIAEGASLIRLVIAENDSLLPVVSESARLLSLIPNVQRTIIPYGGHALLQDNRFKIAKYLETTQIYDTVSPISEMRQGLEHRKSSDSVEESSYQTEAKDRQTRSRNENILRTSRESLRRPFRRTRLVHSPVVIGTENIPEVNPNRPVLIVCNHTLLGGIDAFLVLDHLLEHRNVMAKSLAHPMLFQAFSINGDRGDKTSESSGVLRLPGLPPLTKSDLERCGVVPVSPRAFVNGLANNEWLVLFPGGAREALKRKSDEKYSVHWPNTAEFVRAAAKYGATILPVATVGTEDSVNLVLDSVEIRNAVELFSRVTGVEIKAPKASDGRPLNISARRWQRAPSLEDLASMIPPLTVPGIPERVYVRFGAPIEVPMAARNDRELARAIYRGVRRDVERGIQILLRKRKQDPFRSSRARAAFHARHGTQVVPPASPAWMWETRAGAIDED